MIINRLLLLSSILLFTAFSCSKKSDPNPQPVTDSSEFYFGADLSYANQILDNGGEFKVDGSASDPYAIFANHNTSLARFRIWHNPAWIRTVYNDSTKQLYSDLADVTRSIQKAKDNGMKVLLDFHYSDTWADPSSQQIPGAWIDIRNIDVLTDSVYGYTLKVLSHLNEQGMMPEFVQIGNETNCGLLYSNAPDGFPAGNICNGQWGNFNKIIKAAIKAVRDVTALSTTKTKIALHVADPKNVDWFYSSIVNNTTIKDFDIIGFSYYPLWHTTIPLNEIGTKISGFKTTYKKDVMILETAYPWTTDGADNYNNLLGGSPISGYPFTQDGQYNILIKLTQQVKAGKGLGLIYWEPDWITTPMKDLWGTGSAWENAAFFDYTRNATKAIEYSTYKY